MTRRAMRVATGAAIAMVFALVACSPDLPEGPVADAGEATPTPAPSPSPSPVETIDGRFGSKHTPRPPSPPPVVIQTPVPLPSTMTGIWLGVLATVRDPNKLDDDLKKLRKRYGSAVMTGQVFCWPEVNIGRHMPDDYYILAFITGSRPAAENLVADSGYKAEFYARVTDRCGG